MKKLNVLLAFLAMIVGFLVISKPSVAFADSVDITITNPKLSKNSLIGTGQTTEFSFDFAVPDGAKKGDTTVISLPKELQFQRNQTIDVYAQDGTTVVATAVIDTATKTFTMTYTDYVESHNDVTGKLSMVVKVDGNNVSGSQTLPAKVTVNGNTTIDIDAGGIGYGVGQGDADTTDFWKYGWYDYDTDEVRYVINLNTKAATVNNVVVHDEISTADFEYVDGTFSISEGDWVKNSTNNWHLSQSTNVTATHPVQMSADKRSFSINFGTITKGYSITYRVKANHKLVNGEIVKNSADYISDGQRIDGSRSTNTYQSATGQAGGYNFSLTVKKTDKDSGDVLAGAVFDIIRKSTGVSVGTITTNAEGTGTISGLLRDDYIVREVTAPAGYQLAEEQVVAASSFSSTSASITIQDEKTKISVSGKKTWIDGDNQDGIRPSSVTLHLLANGKDTGKTTTATAANNWEYSFEGLNENDDNGNAIVYTVKEDAVEGYTSQVDGMNVTNTHTPEVKSISGTKVWDDKDDQDGIRPTSITVHLLANGKEVASKEVTEADDWKYAFENLPAKEAGNDIVYTVTEDTVKDYTTSINGYDITNTYAPGKTSVTVVKSWDDANDQDGIRPESIKVQLYANGQKQGEEVEVTAANNWTYTWSDLDEKSAGQAIEYTVKEVSEVDGYTTTVSDNVNGTVTITNAHTPEVKIISGTKTWDDADNQDGIRPESITVNLLANGEVVDTVEVTAADNWAYSFENLPVNENGQEIAYTVTETPVENYTTTIEGYDITNTYAPGKTSVTVVKSWDDANNQDGSRPNSIKVQLYANGEKVGEEVTLTAKDNWSYTWSDLDEKSEGKVIEYTVKEVDVPKGYKSTVGELKDGVITIKNSHTPEKPETPKTPEKPSTKKPKSTKPSTEKPRSEKTTKLPSTGEQISWGLTGLGIILLLALVGGVAYKKKH